MTSTVGRPSCEPSTPTRAAASISTSSSWARWQGQVVETVGKHHPGAIYVYQAEQLGTGHATKQGAAVLAALRYEGAVLVVAGDRLLDAQVVEQLIAEYRSTAADMVFLVGAASGSELGHVVRDPDGAVVGIIEHKDVLAREALRRIRHLALAAAPEAIRWR